MANFVTNIIIVKKDIEKFKKYVLNKNGEFDFYEVFKQREGDTPDGFYITEEMRMDLDIESSSRSYKPIRSVADVEKAKLNGDTVQLDIQLTMEKLYKEEMTQQDFVASVMEETVDNPYFTFTDGMQSWTKKCVDTIARGFYNYKKYLFTDWYTFNNAVFGTKWNAMDTYIKEVDGKLLVKITTAWCTPTGVWKRLAEDFDFTVAYADEGVPENSGIVYAENGEVVDKPFSDYNDDEKYLATIFIRTDYSIDEEFQKVLEEDYGLTTIPVERQQEIKDELSQYIGIGA